MVWRAGQTINLVGGLSLIVDGRARQTLNHVGVLPWMRWGWGLQMQNEVVSP